MLGWTETDIAEVRGLFPASGVPAAAGRRAEDCGRQRRGMEEVCSKAAGRGRLGFSKGEADWKFVLTASPGAGYTYRGRQIARKALNQGQTAHVLTDARNRKYIIEEVAMATR